MARPDHAAERIDVAAVCGLVALAVGFAAIWISLLAGNGRLSSLIRMAPDDPIAELVRFDPDFSFTGAHYDGIYFFAMALDPLATGRAHELIDLAANRYGHPAYSWVAGLLALFDPRRVVLTLAAVNLVGLFVAGSAASRVASLLGRSPWLGLTVAVSPGLLFAAANDTSEVFGAALMFLVLWAWLGGRFGLAGALIVPLCFAKEHLLLVPVGLALWETVVLRRGGDRATFLRRLLVLVPGPVLYASWLVYVHSRFGIWSFTEGDNLVLPFPLVGWYESLRMAADMALGDFGEMQIGTASIALQAAALAAVLIGVARALRLRTPVDAAFLLLAVLTVYLRWTQLMYPKDLIRGLAFIAALLPFVVFAVARRGDRGGSAGSGATTVAG